MAWSIVIKFIPENKLPALGNKETEIDVNKKGSVLNMKRGKSFEKKLSAFSGKRGS